MHFTLVAFRYGYVIECDEVQENADGEIEELRFVSLRGMSLSILAKMQRSEETTFFTHLEHFISPM